MDFGIKATIIEHLKRIGDVIVVPSSTSAEEMATFKAKMVFFLSNGPGDPEVVWCP